MVEVIRALCWHQKFIPKGFSALSPELYTSIKSLKMCIKSDFKEIILKLAPYGQREKAFLLSSKFCPRWIVCPCPGLYIYGETWKKKYIKSDFKTFFFLNLQQMGKVIRVFCWHQKFVPKGLAALDLGLYTYIKSLKMCIKSDGQSDKGFLLTSTFVSKGLSASALGLYTCIKALKYIPGPGVMWVFTGPLVLCSRIFTGLVL